MHCLAQWQRFYRGLKETGFIEGTNVSVEFRWADRHYDRLPSLAAELMGHNVSVIWANDAPSAFAAKAATKTIPIVVISRGRPGQSGPSRKGTPLRLAGSIRLLVRQIDVLDN
jgi:hypothetical protein